MQTKTLRRVLPISTKRGTVIGFTLKGGEVVSSGSDEFAEYKTSELRKIHKRQRDDKHKAQVIARNTQ